MGVERGWEGVGVLPLRNEDIDVQEEGVANVC